ncbi:MAG: Gfo/Idh/MocA family oxidoreductase [Thermoguttaceae bacterium]|nr:Gfo/Idh/MocA family oxidoreductase [Thermoguttaceae bacterium]MDW8079924.1 Gfo/Idh/MocA family oxidoreductase [Thermoguttaceae bacterium]
MRPISRRCLLRATASGVGLGGLAPLFLPAKTVFGTQANARLRVALVGVGGRGRWFVETIPRMEDVVALCDVNEVRIDEAFRFWEERASAWENSPQPWEREAAAIYRRHLKNRPKTFVDFRKMFAEMSDGIDAAVVATPDHTHAVASAAAIRAGKHVFCEKPLTRTVHESRALRDLARKFRVATAMGNQGTYSGPFRRAVELIRNGTLGEIREVYVWNDGGGADRDSPPQGQMPVPERLHWDLWLGPASWRPYHRDWMNRNAWRDFGTGQLGNWASHTANLAFMALEVYTLWESTEPPEKRLIRVRAECSRINRLSFPRWEKVFWEVPARGNWPPITIQWINGAAPGFEELVGPVIADAPTNQRNLWHFAGTLIVGTKGKIHTTGHNMWCRLLPTEQFAGVQCDRPETLPSSRGPEQDWFAACRGGPAPWSNFDYAAALNEFLMLGNIATQVNDAIEYDPVAMKIVNNTEADSLLRSQYREGWSL